MLLDAYKCCFSLSKTDLYSLRQFPWVQGMNNQSGFFLLFRYLQAHTNLKCLYLLRKLNNLSLVMLFDLKFKSILSEITIGTPAFF